MAKKYERALKLAYEKSPPTKAVYGLLLSASDDGDARATYALATWYIYGSPFTPINKKRAAQLLKKAAGGGEASAAHDLAVAYENGDGVKKSPTLAFESNMRGALLGCTQCYYEVGRMYFYGIGVGRNRRLAGYWLAKAETFGIK